MPGQTASRNAQLSPILGRLASRRASAGVLQYWSGAGFPAARADLERVYDFLDEPLFGLLGFVVEAVLGLGVVIARLRAGAV